MQSLHPDKTIEQTLLNLDDLRRGALLSGDEATINRLFADQLLYVHSSAIVDTKASYLRAMRTGELAYQSIELRDRQVQVAGDYAILTGIAHMNIVMNGMPRSSNIRYTTTWRKQENTWKMIVFASTPLPSLHSTTQHPNSPPSHPTSPSHPNSPPPHGAHPMQHPPHRNEL